MNRRRVGLVILCEDRQQEVFCRKLIKEMNWNLRRHPRIEIAPRGKGSAKKFVLQEYPNELAEYRSKRNKVSSKLLVVIDGDELGVTKTLNNLSESCENESIEPRQNGENVAIFVPTWNIETWLAYLSGQTVDEGNKRYPRLEKPGDCQVHARTLAEMCRNSELREPAPESLRTACEEYRVRLNER